jgi:hypothetical protein
VRGPDGGLVDLGARFGPYFALTVDGSAAGLAGEAGWAPVAELGDPATGAFARRVGAVRAALAARTAPGDVEERVAVSVAQLGLCARLLAPALALTVLTGHAPGIDPRRLYWRDVLGEPFPLAAGAWPGPFAGTAAPGPRAAAAGIVPAASSESLARGFTDGVLHPVIAPVVTVAGAYPVSARVLWGNVASGVAGAAKMIGLAEPALAASAWGVVGALCVGEGPLRDAGGLVAPARFLRRSCCLIYRLGPGPGRALCEDCVLTRR